MYNELKEKIFNIIAEVVQREEQVNVDTEENYIMKYRVTSVEFIKIIARIEEAFNVEIPDELLVMKEFNTLDKIVTFLEKNNAG